MLIHIQSAYIGDTENERADIKSKKTERHEIRPIKED